MVDEMSIDLTFDAFQFSLIHDISLLELFAGSPLKSRDVYKFESPLFACHHHRQKAIAMDEADQALIQYRV